MLKKGTLLVIAAFWLTLNAAAQQAAEHSADAECGAVYGEVKSVDKDAMAIGIETYDYEKEKEVVLMYHIGKDTSFEAASGFNDIKVGDWVDMEYHIDREGRMIADSILLEIEPFSEEDIKKMMEDIEEEIIIE